jgi:phosphatidylserine/phosphatidylglycerophosphate/cardiolipin synthase-like enzyme
MRKFIAYSLILICCLATETSSFCIELEVFFSPHGGCTAAIVNQILNAKKSVLVQAYGFSSQPIAAALIEAKKKGVEISIIVDRSNKAAKYSKADEVKHGGCAVWTDDKHAIAHNKVIIIDQSITITGSFNFSDNAENNNAENLVIIHDTITAEKYISNWQSHLKHSTPYKKNP